MTALRLVSSSDGEPPLSAIERYEIYMRGRGLAERTIAESLQAVNRLQRYSGYPADAVPGIQVSRYLGQFTAITANSYYGILWRWFSWLAVEDGIPNPMDRPGARAPRRPRSEPRPVSTEQLRELLSLRLRHRTRVMILLAAFAGLRVHEIAKIKGEDVDATARTIYVCGKGGHSANVPMHPLIGEAAEGMPRRGYWFPTRTANVEGGLHVRREHVGQTIKAAMERAGIADGTAHRLRHWYGSTLVDGGTDLRTAQVLLRHSQLNTTAIYVRVRDRSRIEAIDRLTLGEDSGAT